MKILTLFIVTIIILVSCTKKHFNSSRTAYSDLALLDSCKAQLGFNYYKNQDTLRSPASNSPHGNFKLRFNSIGYKALTASGKLPIGATMPNGSMVVKDIYNGTNLSLYSFMYKKNGSWIWGEIEPNGKILYSVDKDPSVCTNCHSQSGQRDLITSFSLH